MTDSYQRLNRPTAFATQVVPAAVYVTVMFYGGLIRMAPLPELGPVPADKLLHVLAFGVLAWLMVRAARFFFPHAPLARRLLLGALASSVVGAVLELCQAFVPYRSADFWDWLADSVGAGLAVIALGVVLNLLPTRAHG